LIQARRVSDFSQADERINYVKSLSLLMLVDNFYCAISQAEMKNEIEEIALKQTTFQDEIFKTRRVLAIDGRVPTLTPV
jgi:hypothetical protein